MIPILMLGLGPTDACLRLTPGFVSIHPRCFLGLSSFLGFLILHVGTRHSVLVVGSSSKARRVLLRVCPDDDLGIGK